MHNVTYYINSNDYVYTETSHVSDYYQNNMQTTRNSFSKLQCIHYAYNTALLSLSLYIYKYNTYYIKVYDVFFL